MLQSTRIMKYGGKILMRIRQSSIVMLAMVLLPAPSSSQVGSAAGAVPTRAPTPCANDPERHRFDFWIGEWTVTTKSGGVAGSSVIESVSGGCALLENWTSLSGGRGKSLNAYNPVTRQWQQYWIGQDGAVSEFRTSEFNGTSMIFFVRDEGNPRSIGRLTFTPIDSATVRQHSESSSDAGKSWTTQYDFYYHRRTG
jgi:hypothetical protein